MRNERPSRKHNRRVHSQNARPRHSSAAQQRACETEDNNRNRNVQPQLRNRRARARNHKTGPQINTDRHGLNPRSSIRVNPRLFFLPSSLQPVIRIPSSDKPYRKEVPSLAINQTYIPDPGRVQAPQPSPQPSSEVLKLKPLPDRISAPMNAPSFGATQPTPVCKPHRKTCNTQTIRTRTSTQTSWAATRKVCHTTTTAP